MKNVAENIKSNCSGGSACYAVCPVNCISMKVDEEGILQKFVISGEIRILLYMEQDEMIFV